MRTASRESDLGVQKRVEEGRVAYLVNHVGERDGDRRVGHVALVVVVLALDEVRLVLDHLQLIDQRRLTDS